MPYGVYLLFLFSLFNYLVYIYSTILIIKNGYYEQFIQKVD